MSWTEERIERLKKMWHDGATASQIAEELGGVSRNAVIGKAHRLGLDARPSPVKPGEEKEHSAGAAPAKAATPKKAAPAPKPAPEAEAPQPAARAAAPQPQRQRPQPSGDNMTVGYVAGASLKGIALESLEIRTRGTLDLRGFLGLDESVAPGYEAIDYDVRIKGDGSRQDFEEIHRTVMKTSPNYFNMSRPIRMNGTLSVG